MHIALAIVSAVSFVAARLLQTTELMRWICGSPTVLAMSGAVIRIFKDQAEYERKLLLKRAASCG